MIYVDDIFNGGAPWAGGRSCHCWSDTSEAELTQFCVVELGLRSGWIQRKSVTHFDLSPRLRARAIALGATALSTRGREWRAAVARARLRGLTNARPQTSATPGA